MKRHEYWRHQYRKNRYLRHLSDEELHQRGRDVFNINLTLTLEKQIGLLSIQDFGSEAMERWTHYLEECSLRGFRYEDGMKQMRVKDAVPDLLGDLGERASAALRAEGGLKTAQLLKFGKAKYLTPLIEEGKLRIQPASSFSDPLHNAAVGDNETTRSFKMAISGEKILDLMTEHGLPRDMANRDDLEIHVQYFTDYWMTCFGRALQPRMAVDFDADSMVAVLNKDEFYRRLRRAFREKVDYSSMKHGPVQYFDPYLPNCNFKAIPLIKPLKYYYQHEYRYFWLPSEPVDRLDFVDIEMGPLGDICRLITW